MRRLLCWGLLACWSVLGWAADAPLTTHAERSKYRETGRYAEVLELCAAYAQAYPEVARCDEFGRTPEGRPMVALVASRSGAMTPALAREKSIPVILIQGGIHAGEIDGKDAGFWAMREILDGKVAEGALGKLVLVFVPVFNVDGHERFGAWNRPNQRGPKEMGWRSTAQNYNLNRDYMKADAPEMQAMLKLINTWDPLVTVDLHVTDGAKFEHDVSITLEPVYSGDDALRQLGLALRTSLIEDLTRQGSLPLPFYPSFVVNDDPSSGFADGVATPRFSTGYLPLRNRIGILVETHSWKDYKTRVQITRNALVSLVTLAGTKGFDWIALAARADKRATLLGGQNVPLAYAAQGEPREIEFRGYAYTRTPSPVSGALMTRYDEDKPEIWKVPLRDDVRPSLSVTAPLGGYIVPAAHADWVAQRLDLHGVEYRRLDAPIAHAATQTFRAERVEFSPNSVEGHQRLTVTGAWKDEARDVPAGSLWVPIGQAKSRLVVALLEPQAPDSLVAWGDFNTAFERKEYMEDYVAEEVAEQMLKKDAKLAAEFKARLDADPAFAQDPAARLDFFYRRHSSFDERFELYPVMRVGRGVIPDPAPAN